MMLEDFVWTVSIVLMALVAAVFASVAADADSALADYAPVVARAYRGRVWLFLLAVAVLVAVNYRTLGRLPYLSRAAAAGSAGAVRPVTATGEQWAWTISPNAFKVGQTAEFHVTSKDVNHGFALYAPDFRVVAQTQAMPGYTNILRYTFTQPGVYSVLCLEYCGLAHHDMKSAITVSAD